MWRESLTAWGTFHIVSFVIMICFLVLGIIAGSKCKSEQSSKRDRILSITGFILIILEAFKIIFRCNADGINEQSLQLISFQICSIPMYLLPLVMFVKKESVKNTIVGFISFMSFMSAFCYFIKPASALNSPYIIISIQAILWHCILVGIGTFSMVAYGMFDKDGIKKLKSGYILWIVLAVVAVILNMIILKSSPNSGVDLFYIAQSGDFNYPLLSLFFKGGRSPYPVFLIAFCIYYGLGCLAVYGIGYLIKSLVGKKNK